MFIVDLMEDVEVVSVGETGYALDLGVLGKSGAVLS